MQCLQTQKLKKEEVTLDAQDLGTWVIWSATVPCNISEGVAGFHATKPRRATLLLFNFIRIANANSINQGSQYEN